ncbi:DUF1801 domain-containing protein [Marinomonas ostreistagni]|uniref:DUF1801 domain-containing protein n=1 Tax=Marinomonas ostreistagni TaxID=359209 RepID=UPI001951E3A6|nr:DUF1801 domain-containing protein [Marinomonas ostreistagni]MBM6551183.1 DUF1801 domain-containing protein [Marinomonas ostreistagni]
MLTTLDLSALESPSPTPNDDVNTDLDTLNELIFAIAPEAKVIPEQGVRVFYLGQRWAFALVPHQKSLSLYHSSELELSSYLERLNHVHLGDHCLIIDNLDEVNLNVLVELLAMLKVDIQRQQPLDFSLH